MDLSGKDENKWKKPPRDPAVGEVLGAVNHLDSRYLYMNSYLSRSTIYKLRKPGGTRRPQHMTLVGVLGAAGLEYRITRKK